MTSMTSMAAIANAFHRRVTGSSNRSGATTPQTSRVDHDPRQTMAEKRMAPSPFTPLAVSSSPTLKVLSARHGNEPVRRGFDPGQGMPQPVSSLATSRSAPVPISSSATVGGVLSARFRNEPFREGSELGQPIPYRPISPSVEIAMDAVVGKLPGAVDNRRAMTPFPSSYSHRQHQRKQPPRHSVANLALRSDLHENLEHQVTERVMSDTGQPEQVKPLWATGYLDAKPRIPKSKTMGFLPVSTPTPSALPLAIGSTRESTIRAATPVTPTASSSRGFPIVENIHEVCLSTGEKRRMEAVRSHVHIYTFVRGCG